MVYAVILAGGKGTRLYPLSRKENPKQFLELINKKSFLKNTFERVSKFVDQKNIYVVTNNDYYEKVIEELPEIEKENIFVEPYNKETATCISYSAAKLYKKDKDALMMIFPSDHYIEKEEEFVSTIESGKDIAENKRGLVTIGIEPTRAETGFGYIEMGREIKNKIYRVERFTEKPNIEVAKDFILKGSYLWNSGIFIWRCDVFLRELEKYLPKIYRNIMYIYEKIDTEEEEQFVKSEYEKINGISVDFGIMQRTRKGYVIKAGFRWDDIGTFDSVSRFLNKHKGNAVKGNVLLEETENCTIINDEKLLIGFGVKDLVIITTNDVVLIMDKSREQEVKYLVNKIKQNGDLNKYL